MEETNDIFDHIKAKKTPLPDDSYFESLAKTVIVSQTKKPIIPLYKRPVFWISSVAAAILVSLLVINFKSTSMEEADPLLALNNISSDDLRNYIDENLDDFETDLIVEVMNESSVDELNFSDINEPSDTENVIENSKISTISFDEIDAQDILDYFNTEGIDLEDLEDEDSFI